MPLDNVSCLVRTSAINLNNLITNKQLVYESSMSRTWGWNCMCQMSHFTAYRQT